MTSCYLWCKDTNFNANHNSYYWNQWQSYVVIYGAKILILMQITTVPCGKCSACRCYLWCKDTNFNANHNSSTHHKWLAFVVIYGAKILILMQITTECTCYMLDVCCYLWCKDTNFNANHNGPAGSSSFISLLFMVQRY